MIAWTKECAGDRPANGDNRRLIGPVAKGGHPKIWAVRFRGVGLRTKVVWIPAFYKADRLFNTKLRDTPGCPGMVACR